MNKILLSLSLALASLTLMPTTASALGSCAQECSCSTPCIRRCTLGSTLTSCGFVEICNGMCVDNPNEEASAMDVEEYEYSEEELVCRALEG